MSRRRKAEQRKILPDPKHNDVLVSKFINCLMRNGKKGVAEKILYGALDLISQREEVERLALESEKIQPHLSERSVRKVIVVPDRLVNIVV